MQNYYVIVYNPVFLVQYQHNGTSPPTRVNGLHLFTHNQSSANRTVRSFSNAFRTKCEIRWNFRAASTNWKKEAIRPTFRYPHYYQITKTIIEISTRNLNGEMLRTDARWNWNCLHFRNRLIIKIRVNDSYQRFF